ncbi:MAG: WG repeat-containing protein, partial [Saprospiraceae bacterium]
MASRLIFLSALVAILHCPMMGQMVFPFCQGNLYGLVSEKGTIILSPRYDAIKLSEHPAQSEVFVVYHQGAYGLVDKTGKEVVPPKFDNMFYRGAGFAWYYNDNYHERGLHVISSRERKEVYHSDSLRLIEILGQGKYFGEIYNGKTGHTSLINESGKIVIPDIHGKVSIEFTDYDCPLIILGSISKPFF